jgi:methyl-accepting chemotaxis protein
MSIKFKLISCIFLLAAALAVTTVVALMGVQYISERTRTIVADRVEPMAQLKSVSDMYASSIVNTAQKLKSGAIGWTEADKTIHDALATAERQWNVYMATYLTPEETGLAQKFADTRSANAKGIQELVDIVGRHDQAALNTFVETRLYPTIDPIHAAVDALADLQIRVAHEEFQAAVAQKSSLLLWLGVVAAVSLVIVGVSVRIVLAGVAGPLNRIQECMRRLAAGELDVKAFGAGRKDEIGAMATAVEIFRDAAIANKRLERDAEANRLQAESDRVRLQAEAEASAQQRLRQATAGLASGLRRLAAGDLSFQLDEAFAPDFEQLRLDLNAAVGQLGETLAAVAHATHSIDDGTREIGDGANDLSKRTEQQAAALEQTAAALDEITVNVTNSSKRADEARSVAVEANGSAAQSGKVVAAAVDAMQRIEQSSGQISNIIGVIDEIAFQTNLLALNAGVEAARAGEAGKGFAVVAQEVRELAQRSAKAAKEIKELIRNSSVEVQGGVKLVRETGESLKTIEQYIVTINRHMDAIATSAREQSVGLAEVNTAVNQMDQVTQQNAAMVEQTSAASATLANESNRLQQMISQFTVPHAGAPQSAQGHRYAA